MLRWKSQDGFSLIEIIVSIGIGTIATLAVAHILGWTAQQQAQAIAQTKLEEYKQHLVRTITHRGAWANTILQNQSTDPAQPGAMNCLLSDSSTPCLANSPQPFALYDPANRLVYDSRGAEGQTSGLTVDALPCNTFSMAGNDNCPFRYDLKWSAVCSPSGNPPCVNPQVLVSAHLHYRPSSARGPRVNEDRYSINGLLIEPLPCLARNNQVYLTNTTGANISTTFTVPSFNRQLIVEMWSGGGGGAAYVWPASVFASGNPGGDSSFGAVVAPGAPGASSNEFSNCSWWFVNPPSGPGFMFPWAANPTCNGYDAQGPTDPTLLSSIAAQSCAPIDSLNAGGRGGVGIAASGQIYGGGGASGQSWVTDGATFAFLWVPTSGNVSNGGRYAAATFTPATLPPGTSVPVNIGAGGAGAMGWGFACFGGVICLPWPGPAGNGAGGVVKITWE